MNTEEDHQFDLNNDDLVLKKSFDEELEESEEDYDINLDDEENEDDTLSDDEMDEIEMMNSMGIEQDEWY